MHSNMMSSEAFVLPQILHAHLSIGTSFLSMISRAQSSVVTWKEKGSPHLKQALSDTRGLGPIDTLLDLGLEARDAAADLALWSAADDTQDDRFGGVETAVAGGAGREPFDCTYFLFHYFLVYVRNTCGF